MIWKAALVALFAFVVALIALALVRPSNQPQQQSYSQSTQQNSQNDRPDQNVSESWWNALWRTTWREPINIFTAVLALATTLLVIVSIFQSGILLRADRTANRAASAAEDAANAAGQSASIAERALIAGQRAFVYVVFNRTANRDIKTGDINLWGFSVNWTNAGNTPTRNMVNHTNVRLFDEIPDEWDFPDQWSKNVPPEKRRAVPMGVAPHGSVESDKLFVDINGIEDVINGRKFLYFWGWASYNDVFPNTEIHITRFAVQIE